MTALTNPPPDGLAGLAHLISVCRTQRVRLDLCPPPVEGLRSPATLLGQALDPQLRSALSTFDGFDFRDWHVFPAKHLESINSRMHPQAEERLGQMHRYAKTDSLSYYLATVPSLANENGIQPVMYLGLYLDVEMLPVASSVDKAFDLYARYLEELVARYGPVDDEDEDADSLQFGFPYSVANLVAQDEPLVRMLERKQFDFLTAWDKDSTEWVVQVLQEARRLT